MTNCVCLGQGLYVHVLMTSHACMRKQAMDEFILLEKELVFTSDVNMMAQGYTVPPMQVTCLRACVSLCART